MLSALGPSGDNVDVRNVSKRLKQGDKEELAVPLEKVVPISGNLRKIVFRLCTREL